MKAEETTVAEETTGVVEPTEDKVMDVSKEDMDKLIRHHVYASMGVSLIPIPLVDFVGLTAVQVNMLRKISGAYGIPFFKDKVKNVLSSLAGGAFPTLISIPLAASLTKFVPAAGMTLGVVSMPIVAGATTYAIAKVFVQHFASGGTFLSFDPEIVKDYYAQMFKEGQKVAAEMK